MSQEHRAAQVSASKHPKKKFDEHNIVKDENGEKSLEGQLQKVLVGHSRHAGTSLEKSEHMIKSERDSSPALNKALPVIGDDQDSD